MLTIPLSNNQAHIYEPLGAISMQFITVAQGAGLDEKEGHHQYTAVLCSLLGTGLFYLDAGVSRTRRGDTFPHARHTVHLGERRCA